MSDTTEAQPRSYGCSYGCGNPFDFVITSIQDGEAQCLCTSCFIRTAMDMVTAIMEPNNPEVQQRVSEAGIPEQVPMDGRPVAARGHEAPVNATDPDAIERYEGYVLEDELPDVA